ncbi:nuclease-related domain-containing protein [Cryobacterium zongtaii]|uniref:nuclease-related domain-containing protein n=1 Tax=Cryobacterium zongtaii TaxID=1259217 RepID=UPI001FCC8081|nr:nuclease-related domain-containing protein [Cryobacterium zongtaii]
MSGDAALPPKTMRLRYAGRCRICALEISAGTMAVYERETKTVVCLECPPNPPLAAPAIVSTTNALPLEVSTAAGPEPQPEPAEVFTGVAGASAKREYDRRKDRRQARIRDDHPYLGKLILAVSDDPQSTRAWAIGARGEEVLGQRLDKLTGRNIHVLHDRRIPRTRANIDHIAVCPTGVFVIDAKKYQGRPSLRAEGGLFRPRTEKLIVGSRDCTKLVDGAHKQVDLVRSALEDADLEGVPVRGLLCFVDADWPLFGGDFTIDGVHVTWPRRALENLMKPGPVDDQTARHIHRTLASCFPPA